jgi:nucleotide-binding universal stress UspA family protein
MLRAMAGMMLIGAVPLLAAAQQPFPAAPAPAPIAATPAADPAPVATADTPVAGGSVPVAADPSVLTTRQSSFTIPFSVDPRSGATEVQLFVSTDRGASWRLDARQRPEDGQFLFRAAQDGEFWFASHTVTPRAAQAPARFAPELRVRVDTTSPQVELEARVGSSGEIIARWQAVDADLVVESVKLEYQPSGEHAWQPVVLDPAKTVHEVGKASGEAVWFARTQQRGISLRIVARDAAGNSAIVNRGVYLPNIAQRSPPPASAAPSAQPAPGVVAAQRTPAPLNVDPFRSDDLRITDKPVQRWTSETPPASTDDPARLAASAPPDKPLPAYAAVSVPVASAVANRADADAPQDPFARRNEERRQQGVDSTGQTPSGEMPSNVPAPTPERDDLPAGEQPSFTNKLQFKLDYDSDDVPLEQIAAVELWGTHDGGRTWLKWGEDADKQSPFEVEVEHEGVFGYRIVVVHKNGMASHAPRAGDAADIWVGVDTARPEVKLRSVAFGKGHQAGHLIIHWDATDQWLTPRPITLLYAIEPQGPWSTVAAGLANSGEYLWRVEPSVPRRIYLKVEARDLAGNLTEDQLPSPVELEGLVSRGRIRAVIE